MIFFRSLSMKEVESKNEIKKKKYVGKIIIKLKIMNNN